MSGSMIEITIKKDEQTPEEFTFDQFHLLAGSGDKVVERVCNNPVQSGVALVSFHRISGPLDNLEEEEA